MNSNEILNIIEEKLEICKGTLSLDHTLAQIPQWDSMAVLSFLALADEDFHKILNGEMIKKCKKVNDLVKLLE